jgi:hypothetical protein
MISDKKAFPWAGYTVLTPLSRSIFQLSINFDQYSAKMGSPGEKHSGSLFIAMSPARALPVSSNILTDPEE